MSSTMSPQTMPITSLYNIHNENDNTPSSNDLRKLKEISENLKLTTRRPSVVQWKQIIEYRKSRGQYASKIKPQYLDSIVDESLLQNKDESTLQLEVSTEDSTKMTSREFHAQMFQENQNTPTKMTSPKSVAPTPIRRCRRIAQTTIPENFSIDGNNNKDSNMTSQCCTITTSNDDATSSQNVAVNPQSSDNKTKANDETERYKNLNESLGKLRSDLIKMRMEDHKLARQLLNTRAEMNRLMAVTSCEEHALMLDDVAYEFEEEMAVTNLIKACDLSNKKPATLLSAFSPLRHIGVHRLNLNTRRFSIR